MAISTKIIRGRIRSVGNTKKITKAMELVSASKMRRAVEAVALSRPYSQAAWEAVTNIAARVSSQSHPMLKKRSGVRRILYILITSNRGLCGGFNAHAVSDAMRFSQELKKRYPKAQASWIVMGKKGGEYLARQKKDIFAEFEKPDVVTDTSEVSSISRMVIDEYLSKKADRVYLLYTDFVSAMVQKPRVRQLLPFEKTSDEHLGTVEEPDGGPLFAEKDDVEPLYHEEYLIEPSPEAILDYFLRQLLNVQMYQAVLETVASEHASRMMAMRQATDAATDMISELTLMFNQARQAAITAEIAEISGGKAALE